MTPDDPPRPAVARTTGEGPGAPVGFGDPLRAARDAGGSVFRRAGDRPVGLACATRSVVIARRGMVCASQPLAAQVGLDVLRRGGSAVDAALATNAMLGVVEPTNCGIGGDLFALVWDPAASRLVGLDASGRAPRGLGLAELQSLLARRGATAIPERDALAVSVPGCVDGWFALHGRYGRLPMESLLEPAIAQAREGFGVSAVIAGEWARAAKIHGAEARFAATFLPGGRAPREGEIFANPELGATYERLAREGRDAFYAGPVAAALERSVQERGGALSVADLAAHRSDWIEPLSVPYRGHELWELPPAGQGLAALQMLRLISAWSLDLDDPLTWHRLIEAKKLVYEDRARFYADRDRSTLDTSRLLSEDYASERRALVDDAHASVSLPAGDVRLEAGDTVYLTATDERGQVVSWIQSNYTGFGTGIVPQGLGFSLQNRGCLFHLDPGHACAYAPGKRPFHTIIPAMLTRAGAPVLSFGVMGGAMQPQGHVQIVTNLLDHGMNVQEAGDAPRWRHEGSSTPTGQVMSDGGTVFLESGVPRHVAEGLAARGHRVVVGEGGGAFGGYQAIEIAGAGERRVYRGASESRKDGAAVGF